MFDLIKFAKDKYIQHKAKKFNDNQSPIAAIPNELFLTVFSFLNSRETSRALSLTCKRFNMLVQANSKGFENKILDYTKKLAHNSYSFSNNQIHAGAKMVILANGDIAISALKGNNYGINIFDFQGKLKKFLKIGDEYVVNLAIAKNGDLIAGCARGLVCIWDSKKYSLKEAFQPYYLSIEALNVTQDNKLICSFSDGSSKMIDLKTKESTMVFGLSETIINNIAVCTQSGNIVANLDSSDFQIYDWNTKGISTNITPVNIGKITSISICAQTGNIAVATANNGIVIFNKNGNNPVMADRIVRDLISVKYLPNGQLAGISNPSEISIFDEQGKFLTSYTLELGEKTHDKNFMMDMAILATGDIAVISSTNQVFILRFEYAAELNVQSKPENKTKLSMR